MIDLKQIIEFEHERISLGYKFLLIEKFQCPKCHSFNFDMTGEVKCPPIYLQIEHPQSWENARYEADRYFCHECQSLWDIVRVNELGGRM
jgi:hypothetical protein